MPAKVKDAKAAADHVGEAARVRHVLPEHCRHNVIVIICCAHLLLVWQFCYCYHFMCSHVTVIIIVYVCCAPGRKGCVDPVCVALCAATLQLRNHQYDH